MDSLFRWMEAITKEDQCINVFLASSEQFFFNWIKSKLANKMTLIVVGDLPKNEIKKYYELLMNEYGYKIQNKISFEDLFELTGLKFLL